MLAGVGLQRSDYTFVPIGTGASALAALVTKRVDAAALPQLEFVTDEVSAHTSFRYFRHPILRDIGNVGYIATPATIASKADVLQRFSRAIVEAAVFVRVNPAAAARLYLQRSGQPMTAEALTNTTKLLTLLQDFFPAADLSNPRIGLVSARNIEIYARYLADYGFLHVVPPGSAVATDRFIAYANGFDRRAIEAYARGMR
jgi:ABC-type nitrate/sulfonate/bicarbonate transport system substrate-binding protein